MNQTKTRTIKIEPAFNVNDLIMPDMMYAKVGSKYKVIIDYQVIDKTKSLTVLRIMYVHQIPRKRIT